jgi:hypothetical protein
MNTALKNRPNRSLQPLQGSHCTCILAAPQQRCKITLELAHHAPLSLPQSRLSPVEPTRTALQQWCVRGRHAQPFGAGQRRLPPTGDTPVGQQILPTGKQLRGESCGSALQGCVRYLSLESWRSGATLRGSCSAIPRKTTLTIFTVILRKMAFPRGAQRLSTRGQSFGMPTAPGDGSSSVSRAWTLEKKPDQKVNVRVYYSPSKPPPLPFLGMSS